MSENVIFDKDVVMSLKGMSDLASADSAALKAVLFWCKINFPESYDLATWAYIVEMADDERVYAGEEAPYEVIYETAISDAIELSRDNEKISEGAIRDPESSEFGPIVKVLIAHRAATNSGRFVQLYLPRESTGIYRQAKS